MINIITQYYKVKYKNINPEIVRKRQDEITLCFKNNLNHKDVDKIHFLYENIEDVEFLKTEGIDINNNKIILYPLLKRITYQNVFEYTNKYLKNKVCVYLHADMCIKSGFDKLIHLNSNIIYALTSHNNKCKKRLKCVCTRQFNTEKGLYGVTFDGFVFKSPINDKVVKEANHIVHRMGSENRLIAILKSNGYNVMCPNIILYAKHIHNIKIFASQHSSWIEMSGECKPLSYYQKIHKKQKKLPYDKKIVGGGIPFYLGSCLFVSSLL